MRKCIECNEILTRDNTTQWGFRISVGLFYIRFNRLCDRHTPRLIRINSTTGVKPK